MLLAAAASFLLFTADEAASMKARRGSPIAVALRREAEKALSRGPWSVTFHRPSNPPSDLGPNDYYSEGPYWWPDPQKPGGPYIRRDGEVNPDRFVRHHDDLAAVCDSSLALGAAAFLWDAPQYSQRAAAILRTWFVDPKTRMTPHLTFGQAVRGHNTGRGTGIIDTRPLISCAQAFAFLEPSRGWDTALSAPLRAWFAAYLQWLTSSPMGLDEKRSGNNHASWWTAQVVALAAIISNAAALEMAWNHFRTALIPGQFRANGSAPREEERTRSLHYSVFNLEALTLVCRMARTHGVDLWRYEAGGHSMTRVAEYLMPYIQRPASWAGRQITPFDPARTFGPALAGLGLDRPEWLAFARHTIGPSSALARLVALRIAA